MAEVFLFVSDFTMFEGFKCWFHKKNGQVIIFYHLTIFVNRSSLEPFFLAPSPSELSIHFFFTQERKESCQNSDIQDKSCDFLWSRIEKKLIRIGS